MRTLRRPMFKIGGSAGEGITSGLMPKRGRVDGPGGYSGELEDMRVSDLGNLTIGQMQDLSKSPKSGDLSKFLVDFGLDIASAPPSGSIFSTAAQSAKAPYQRFQDRKSARAKAESDMFSTLFKGAAEAQATKTGGKGWLEQWKFEQIPILNEKINRLTKKETAGTLTAQEALELDNARDQKGRIVSISPVVEGYIENNKYLVPDEMKRLWEEDQGRPEEERKYQTEKDLDLELDAIKSLEKRFGLATGGRVGYYQGLSVQPQQASMQPQMAQPEMQMPEEMTSISFEELRQRLPAEVTDDIVRLISSSAEAMEDFATIETEQDIANFNKKYGVNLVLPSEG